MLLNERLAAFLFSIIIKKYHKACSFSSNNTVNNISVSCLHLISLSLLILVNSADLDYGRELPLHVTMLPNPSHLDAVDPVTAGKARGRQLTLKDGCYSDLPDSQLGDKVAF